MNSSRRWGWRRHFHYIIFKSKFKVYGKRFLRNAFSTSVRSSGAVQMQPKSSP